VEENGGQLIMGMEFNGEGDENVPKLIIQTRTNSRIFFLGGLCRTR
jgi:hypothetical protein